jgi:hypothetical protein
MPENDPAATQKSGVSCLRLLGGLFAFVLFALAAISLLLSLCEGEGWLASGDPTTSRTFMIACVVLVILALFVSWYTLTKLRK